MLSTGTLSNHRSLQQIGQMHTDNLCELRVSVPKITIRN